MGTVRQLIDLGALTQLNAVTLLNPIAWAVTNAAIAGILIARRLRPAPAHLYAESTDAKPLVRQKIHATIQEPSMIEDVSTPADFYTVYDNHDGLHVVLEAAERIDGSGRPYRHHRLITADGRPGAVIVATRGESVLVVRSRRDAAGRDLWELPRGFGDETDSLHVETAIRELREETGYLTDRAELLGSYVTDSSIYPQRVSVVHCEVHADIDPGASDGEIDETLWLTGAEVWQAMARGMFADAHTLSGLALWGGWRAIVNNELLKDTAPTTSDAACSDSRRVIRGQLSGGAAHSLVTKDSRQRKSRG